MTPEPPMGPGAHANCPIKTTSSHKALFNQTYVCSTKHIIESNTKIIKEMSEGNFDKEKFQKFSNDNKLAIKESIIKSIKDEAIFNSDIIAKKCMQEDNILIHITPILLTYNITHI